MKKLMRALLCLFVLTIAANAADISGKWTGTADTVLPDGAKHFNVQLQLRQSGAEVTGTISDGRNEGEIMNGKIAGDIVTFEIQQGDNGPLWKIKLTASGDQLCGDASGQKGTQTISGRVNLKRN
jgi:hypothetical protein